MPTGVATYQLILTIPYKHIDIEMGYACDNYQSINRVIHRPSQKHHQTRDIFVYTIKSCMSVSLRLFTDCQSDSELT